jgi:hypothetical protein
LYAAAAHEVAERFSLLDPTCLLARVYAVYSMGVDEVQQRLCERGVPRYWQGGVRALAEKLVTAMVLEHVGEHGPL